MSRSYPRILAVVLTLLVIGAFGYWALGNLIHPPAVVDVPISAVKHRVQAIEVPSGWEKIDTKQGFSFYAPPGTRFQRLQGKDSSVGEIVGPTFNLQYDFGYWSNDLSEAKNNQDYSEDRVVIEGRDGLIKRATFSSEGGQTYFAGLYVQQAVFHRAYPGRWAALEIHGTAASVQDRAIIEQMFKTVQFD
jgi:hypothetical protein